MPGFEDAWLDDFARTLGITESRRLVGDVRNVDVEALRADLQAAGAIV